MKKFPIPYFISLFTIYSKGVIALQQSAWLPVNFTSYYISYKRHLQ